MLIGEGEYNLNAMIQIKASNSFLGLNEDIRACQNEETLQKCTTRHYTNNLMKKCGCMPLSISFSEEDPLCSEKDLECAKNITTFTSSCLKPCSGFFITSFTKTDQGRKLEDVFPIFDQYNAYKKITRFPAEFSKYK